MADTSVRAGQIVTADLLNNIFLSFGRKLQEIVLPDDSPTVTFPDIDQSYRNLRIVSTGAFNDGAHHFVALRFNGDAGASAYTWFRSQRFGDFTFAESASGGDSKGTVGLFGFDALQSTVEVLIPGYTLPQFHQAHGVYSGDAVGAMPANHFVGQAVMVHHSAAAVQEIEASGGGGAIFLAGSAFSLYGLP